MAEKEGPDAGLLVFLVGAAFLALVGLVAEAGVVEAQVVAAAASGHPRGGRAAAAGFVAAGCLAAEWGGRAAGTPEGRLRARGSRGCGGGLLRGLSRQELVAARNEFFRRLEGPRVDQVTDVARQFAVEEVGLNVVGCRAVRLSHRTEGLVSPHIG